MSIHSDEFQNNSFYLPSIDFDNLFISIKNKLIIEHLFNKGYIDDNTYFNKYCNNAETLARDFQIWKELKELDLLIVEEINYKKSRNSLI